MAAVFLVRLYEYSPLFYIAVVFTCFIVTTEVTQFSTRVFKKQMRQVKNPFGLEITNPSSASITTGITLTTDCLEDSLLTCYWGCSVQKLYEALQKHVYCFRISAPQALEDALYSEYLYQEQYFIKKDSKEEIYCQLPRDNKIEDFGTVPTSRYPLVALLTLADEDDWEISDIISTVSMIHITDRTYKLSCRILYQYLPLAQGQFHDLKQLFMSANNNFTPSNYSLFQKKKNTNRSLLAKVWAPSLKVKLEPSGEQSKEPVLTHLPCVMGSWHEYFQQVPMCQGSLLPRNLLHCCSPQKWQDSKTNTEDALLKTL
uniref:Cell growth regulator with RING finger domain protein 1 n=1 Tax=Rhinopithecus bieti TaxID=61621 RepID=A0A2K6KBT6_RHIBE